MTNITDPSEIVMEFLRAEVAEVTRVGKSNRHTNTSEQFSGNTVLTQFTVSNTKLLCVNSVVVGGVTLKKYLNYNIDLDNNQINFLSAPATGTNNITIDYDYNVNGTSWIYPDKPRDTLAQDSYPRIWVHQITESGALLGFNETDSWDVAPFQFDVLSPLGLLCTIGSDTKEGQEVVNYLGIQVKKMMFSQNSKINYKLSNPTLLENKTIPFDEDYNLFRRVVSFGLEGKNVGY